MTQDALFDVLNFNSYMGVAFNDLYEILPTPLALL